MPPRCKSLKSELRDLHAENPREESKRGRITRSVIAESDEDIGMGSCPQSSREEDAFSQSPLVSAPVPTRNRFQTISEEGCEALKQPHLKKAARSPTATGAQVECDAIPLLVGNSLAAAQKYADQKYSHVLVVDFECTCDSGEPNYPHEIIEFPVVAVDTVTTKPVAEFRTYIRPVRNPQLTEFCTSLTGIQQSDVDDAPTLKGALDLFDEWLRNTFLPIVAQSKMERAASKPTSTGRTNSRINQPKGKVGDVPLDSAESDCGSSEAALSIEQHVSELYDRMMDPQAASPSSPLPVIFATDGPTDMRHFMYDCHVVRDGCQFPPYFYRWLNVRRAYADHFRTKPESLLKMLRRLGMQFHGQHHCGLDDARNIGRVVSALIQRGHRFQHTSCIPLPCSEDLEAQRRASELMMDFGEDDPDIGKKRSSQHSSSGGKKHVDPRKRSGKR